MQVLLSLASNLEIKAPFSANHLYNRKTFTGFIKQHIHLHSFLQQEYKSLHQYHSNFKNHPYFCRMLFKLLPPSQVSFFSLFLKKKQFCASVSLMLYYSNHFLDLKIHLKLWFLSSYATFLHTKPE